MVRVPELTGGSQLTAEEVILIQNLQSGNFQDETPGGVINGVNQVFTLAAAPSPAESLVLFLNGSRLQVGVDYTLSGTTITFTFAPGVGDPAQDATYILRAYYLRDTA